MKRVTAFVGSARKKSTYDAVCQFLENLRSLGDVEYEIVALSDHRLGTCRGCCLCFDKGEEFCPLKDDRDVLIEKIMASDGVVFGVLTFLDAPGIAKNQATPLIGVWERINIGVFLLWVVVLAVALLRTQGDKPKEGDLIRRV